jgi:hypothetical protein
MPWKFRRRPGVFVELFIDGAIRLSPGTDRDKLTAEERRWLDEEAIPELRREWAAQEWHEAVWAAEER